MFQFPSLAYAPYVFRYASPRITTGGFPHSEIPGSLTGQRLPRAYRSRPRPSSPLGAKASTVCPCSLDQKNSGNRCRYGVFKVHASSSAHTRKNCRQCQPPVSNAEGQLASTVSQNSAASTNKRRGRHDSRRVECRTDKSIERVQRLPT
jgi:hypothetical protein